MREKRILLVGEEVQFDSIKNILQGEGCLVEAATTGRQALEKEGSKEIYVAVLEAELPDMTGVEAARKLKGEHDRIHIIIQTDISGLNGCLDELDLGIDEILLKPVGANELLRAIKEALSH